MTKNPRVIILGAGSSRGANLLNPSPVMADFFPRGQELVSKNHRKLWQLMDNLGLDYKSKNMGSTNIEAIYQNLEAIDAELIYKESETLRSEIMIDLWSLTPASLLELFIIDTLFIPSLEAFNSPCDFHSRLFSGLNEGDVIISFNYDLIAECSLRESQNWNEITGYGLEHPSGIFSQAGIGIDLVISTLSNPHSTIKLLKPHGSINWKKISRDWGLNTVNQSHIAAIPLAQFFSSGTPVTNSLEHESYRDGRGSLDRIFSDDPEALAYARQQQVMKRQDVSFIVPPAISKLPQHDMPIDMKWIWKNIERALSKTDDILVVGYAFGNYETFFKSLFSRCMTNNHNETVQCTVIDPSEKPAQNIQNLSIKLSVTHVANSLEEFASG